MLKDNPRFTSKDRNLVKGAIRRVFSRSELRRKVIDSYEYEKTIESRPRVKKWIDCQKCKKPTPKYLIDLDHIVPIVPISCTLENMSADELLYNLWCKEEYLMPLCKECHKEKTKNENSKRRVHHPRKRRSKNG
jgi:5-methylcytosine-specific restriction endonuclease McrA